LPFVTSTERLLRSAQLAPFPPLDTRRRNEHDYSSLALASGSRALVNFVNLIRGVC
jgi:hypothetical protein